MIHRFQFSLRTLLIVVTLLAVGCGYVTWRAKKTIAERKATLAIIREFGGYVLISQNPSKAAVPFIRKLLGDEEVETIIVTSGSPVGDLNEVFPESEVIEVPAEENPVPFL